MEDSAAILREISSFKDMIDQVNMEIERNIQRTREIDSELLKHTEIEDAYLKRECELQRLLTLRNFELDGFVQVAGNLKLHVEEIEKELRSSKIDNVDIKMKIMDKREKFILQCREFQNDTTTTESKECLLLLTEKEVLEDEMLNIAKKVNALEYSASELVEEIVEEVEKSNSELEVELRQQRSEYADIVKDIKHLKILICSISSFEDPFQ